MPTGKIRKNIRGDVAAIGLSFSDPLKKDREAKAVGDVARRLLRASKIECVYYHPAPYRLVLFGPDGDVAATAHYDVGPTAR